MPSQLFTYRTTITGHEHLYDLGLINMNGRMYDPLMSAFLSPDKYMQDPTTQQGFNRYAYCMYNPLKYVDPSGELYFGWNGNSSYDYEQAERLVLSIRYNQYLEIMQPTWDRINYFSNSLWSQGDSYGGAIGGNGCHGGGSGNLGSPGGGSNPNGPSGNGHGDDDQTNNTTNSSGRPGESRDNPTTADYLFIKCYLHFQIGGGNPLYVDAQSLGLENYSIYEDFVHYINDDGKETYSINLLSNPYMFDNPQVAMALGQIVLTPKGDNMYEIHFDTYDFNFQPDSDRWDNGFFNWRNTGTFYGGLIHGTIFNTTYHMTPMFLGGPFDIIFVNNPIYIPYYP
jgi:RHS repeat-associated core domain